MARTLLHRILTHDMWGVFVDDAPFDPTAPAYGSSATPVLTPSPSVFWADPFFADDSTLLVEQLDYSVGYGRIYQVPLDDPGAAFPVLDDGVHASFPFVITVGTDTLVVPERADTGRMEIYRWDGDTIELVAVALEGMTVADPVIWHDPQTELYFLFFFGGAIGDRHALRLFISDRVDGEWAEHPASPITKTLAGGRPGGALLRLDDGVFRIGQDCVDAYGTAVITFRVDTIDADRYIEHPVGRTTSAVTGFEHGFHTINRSPSGTRFIIDARRYQNAWTSPGVVGARLKRINKRLRTSTGARQA